MSKDELKSLLNNWAEKAIDNILNGFSDQEKFSPATVTDLENSVLAFENELDMILWYSE